MAQTGDRVRHRSDPYPRDKPFLLDGFIFRTLLGDLVLQTGDQVRHPSNPYPLLPEPAIPPKPAAPLQPAAPPRRPEPRYVEAIGPTMNPKLIMPFTQDGHVRPPPLGGVLYQTWALHEPQSLTAPTVQEWVSNLRVEPTTAAGKRLAGNNSTPASDIPRISRCARPSWQNGAALECKKPVQAKNLAAPVPWCKPTRSRP